METVEVLIKIPKDVYDKIQQVNRIISGRRSGRTIEFALWNGVKNGIVLPKNHGRLIEADEVSKGKFHFECECDCAVCSHSRNCECDLINSIPTVIEADKAESEGKE